MRNLLFLLHVYGCVASEQCCIFVQDRRDLLAQERLGLVYGHAGEGRGVNKFVGLRAREPEDRVSQDALEQVVAAAMELDLFAGGDAVLPDGLVQGLPVAALFLDAVHEDVLRSEKRQLVGQMLFGHFRVHGQAADDVEVQREDAVGGEECFRDADAAVGRVVERSYATVIGAGAYSVAVSGSTICYQGMSFPLPSLPTGKVPFTGPEDLPGLEAAVREQYRIFDGECAICMDGMQAPSYALVEQAAQALARAMAPHWPKVVILRQDMAKALGQALMRAGPEDTPFLCMDGISLTYGDTVDIGAPLSGGRVIPVIVKTLAFAAGR